MRAGDSNSGCFREVSQASCCGVPVHACAAAIEQDRAIGTAPYGPVCGPPNGGWQRDQNDLGAFAAYAQRPVAVLFAKISDISAGGLEDPQAEKSEHCDEREVTRRWRLTGSGQQCLKLQVGEPQGDAAGTEGRRTCSAGECSSRPSMTHVR